MTPSDYDDLSDGESLKKDYLLCNGETYVVADYPELAKFLLKDEVQNGDEEQNGDKVQKFKVPNLCNRFISSVMAKGSTKLNEKMSPSDIYSPDSGTETCDCNDPNERLDTKQHRHFIAYGSWAEKPTYDSETHEPQYCSKPNGITYDYELDDDKLDKLPTLVTNDKIGFLPLNNHAFNYYKTTTNSGMIGFGESNSNNVDSVPANILLSRPNHSKPRINCDFTGRSSDAIISGSNTSTKTAAENHGKYYEMLPFIKI